MAYLRDALAQGEIRSGISRVQGDVRVNGKAAQVGARVKPGDIVQTGRGDAVVVMGRDAFLRMPN